MQFLFFLLLLFDLLKRKAVSDGKVNDQIYLNEIIEH